MNIYSNTEQQIYDTIASTMKILGFDIVRLRLLQGAGKVLEILIERLDEERVSIEDCKIASVNISALLDVEDIIEQHYNLEVSSAGVERPLVKIEDFKRFAGRMAQIKTHKTVGESKKFEGQLLGLEDKIVKIQTTKPQLVIDIEFENIKDAKLILTDEMFKEIMKRQPEE